MPEKGTIICQKYQVIGLLGKGGMSKVYLVRDLKLDKKWAVKEILRQPEGWKNRFFIQSAMSEVNVMKKLDHPALPRIVDILEEKSAVYVVMDYVEGENLAVLLKKEGCIEQKVVIRWAKELCDVLLYLHGQNPPVIYRDMKPANIIIDLNGKVKLIDFGIAREYRKDEEDETVNLGTRGYAAPEQFKEGCREDERTDIYSLGVTMHQLLTGLNPSELDFSFLPVRKRKPELSLGIEYIVQKCVKENPKERYQNCKELLFDLNNYEKLSRKYWEKIQRKRKWNVFLKRTGYRLLFIAGVFFIYTYVSRQDFEVLEELWDKVQEVFWR